MNHKTDGMEPIALLLEKIKKLIDQPSLHLLDVELMLDYTKDLYAALLTQKDQMQTEEADWKSTDGTELHLSESAIREVNHLPDDPKIELVEALEMRAANLEAPKQQTDSSTEQKMEAEDEAEPAEATRTIDSQKEPETENAPPEEKLTLTIPLQVPTFVSAPVPPVDIRSFIGINDKYQYIEELFKKDKDAYEETLQEINTFETEEETLEWVNAAIADAYNWNEESETVQMFYKLIHDFTTRK